MQDKVAEVCTLLRAL